MVRKARQCLKDHRGLLFAGTPKLSRLRSLWQQVVEGGSAVMEGQWYQKDAAAEWSLAMDACLMEWRSSISSSFMFISSSKMNINEPNI